MPSGLLVGALPRARLPIIGVSAGEAGLLGACSGYSDTLLALRLSSPKIEDLEFLSEARPERHLWIPRSEIGVQIR
jgi:hypothetical protein